MSELYLVVALGGERVAIAADAIESVVELGAITPVPLAPPHLAGLSALRSRVITVVDAARALGLEGACPGEGGEGGEAVIVVRDGHTYGLVVEEVEDVCPAAAISALSATLAPRWRRVATAFAEIDGELLLLVDPGALIDGAVAPLAA